MPETRPSLDITAGSFAALREAIAARSHAPVEQWNPAHCGHSEMRIDRDGKWWHQGGPITRPALVRLFASVLRREHDGGHVLVTPGERLSIAVEFAALRVIAIRREGEGEQATLALQTNDGEALLVGRDHPLRVVDGLPLVLVRGGIEASFERPVYYELAELALQCDPPGVWSNGCFFALGEQ